jgi:hypothetical protein
VVDWRTDHIRTKVMHEDGADLAAVAAHYAEMERRRRRRSRATASRPNASA